MISAKKVNKIFQDDGKFSLMDYLGRLDWLNDQIKQCVYLGRNTLNVTLKEISIKTADKIKQKLIKKGYNITQFNYSQILNCVTIVILFK